MKFNCEKCNYETDRQLNLNRHIQSKKHLKNTGELSRFHHCTHEGCEYKNVRKCLVTQHLKTHDTYTTHKFTCLGCNITMRGKTELKDHIRTETHKRVIIDEYPQCLIKKTIGGIPCNFFRIDRKMASDLMLRKINKRVLKVVRGVKKESDNDSVPPLSESFIRAFVFEEDTEKLQALITQSFAWFERRQLDIEDSVDGEWVRDKRESMTVNELNDTVHELFSSMIDVIDGN